MRTHNTILLVQDNLRLGLVPNIWIRPNNQRRESDAAKALLTVPDGDHLTLLNVYNEYVQSRCSNLINVPLADYVIRQI